MPFRLLNHAGAKWLASTRLTLARKPPVAA
jgi:hypothetical protein